MTISNPSLGTVRHDPLIRMLFIPDDGCCFVEADVRHQGASVLAMLAAEPELQSAHHAGVDLYELVHRAVFGHTGAVSLEQRQQAKEVFLAAVNMVGPAGLPLALQMSAADAAILLQRLHARFPRIAAFQQEVRTMVAQSGEARTALGRFREFTAADDQLPQAVSFMIAGTCNDLFKPRLVRLRKRLRKPSRIVLFDQDSVLVETLAADVANTAAIMATSLGGEQDEFHLNCRIVSGATWGGLTLYQPETPTA